MQGSFENHTRTHQLYIKTLHCPFVVRGRFTRRGPKGQVYGWDGIGMDGWMGYRNCASIFTYFVRTRTCIYVLLQIIKSFHQTSYSFQNLMLIWGGGTQFSKLSYACEFLNILIQKMSFFFLFMIEISHFFENLKNV